MASTRRKLAEAQFFLAKIEESYYKALEALDGEAAALPFYVSAFLSAARSVTWIMRSEYGDIEGWEEWYKDQAVDSQDTLLLKVFAQLRNVSQKSEPYGMHLRMSGRPRDEVPPAEREKQWSDNPELSRYKVTLSTFNDDAASPTLEIDMVLDSLKIWIPELGDQALSVAPTSGELCPLYTNTGTRSSTPRSKSFIEPEFQTSSNCQKIPGSGSKWLNASRGMRSLS